MLKMNVVARFVGSLYCIQQHFVLPLHLKAESRRSRSLWGATYMPFSNRKVSGFFCNRLIKQSNKQTEIFAMTEVEKITKELLGEIPVGKEVEFCLPDVRRVRNGQAFVLKVNRFREFD